MKRYIRVVLLILLAAVIVVIAAACGNTDDAGGEEEKEKPKSGTEYTVTFESNGGSAVAAVDAARGEKIAEPTAPTKAGYAFGGWYKESGLKNLWDFSSDTVTGSITLYAKWEALSGEDPNDPVDETGYTVTFNSNGGSAVAAVNITPSKKIAEPAVPTKAGYAFKGWYKESGLQNLWDFSTDTVTGSITLYAKGVAAYTVTFNSNGGSAVAAIDVTAEQTLELPFAPTKEGYIFDGWYSDGETLENPFNPSEVTASVTVYAKWIPIVYTVTFESNGGSAVTAADVRYGETADEPAVPTKDGCVFVGWHRESGLNNLWDFSADTVTGHITLYAKWVVALTYALNNDGASYKVAGYTGEVRDIIIPATYHGLPITSVVAEAFKGTDITSIVITSGVTSIGENAFYGCVDLTSIEILDSVTDIGNYAFYSCTGLTEIYFNAVNMNDLSFGNEVFSYAGTDDEGIVVTIGTKVTKIPAYLFHPYFSSNVSYPDIKTVIFEDGSACKSIGYQAFYGCRSLASIEIPEGVTSIGKRAFYYCTSLVSIVFVAGSKLESIGEYAFYNCASLASIEIPEGVTSIGEYAFSDCDRLASIAIPASVKSIERYAFSRCNVLIIYARAASQPSGWNSDWRYDSPSHIYWGIKENNYYKDGQGVQYVIEGGSAILTRAPISAESVTIASSITIGSSVYSVTSIGRYAFYRCDRLASIAIPASVTSIGNWAFMYCYALSSVTFGAGSKLESIGDMAFDSCDSLASIEIPASVTSIGEYAFYYCKALGSVVFVAGSKLESIGYRAFYGCSSLKSVTMNRVTPPILGINAFSNTHSDMKIYVPSGSVAAYKNANEWCFYENKITAKS